jgi:hypothetical protein
MRRDRTFIKLLLGLSLLVQAFAVPARMLPVGLHAPAGDAHPTVMPCHDPHVAQHGHCDGTCCDSHCVCASPCATPGLPQLRFVIGLGPASSLGVSMRLVCIETPPLPHPLRPPIPARV